MLAAFRLRSRPCPSEIAGQSFHSRRSAAASGFRPASEVFAPLRLRGIRSEAPSCRPAALRGRPVRSCCIPASSSRWPQLFCLARSGNERPSLLPCHGRCNNGPQPVDALDFDRSMRFVCHAPAKVLRLFLHRALLSEPICTHTGVQIIGRFRIKGRSRRPRHTHSSRRRSRRCRCC